MNTDTALSEVVDKDRSVEISRPDYAVMTMTAISRENNIYSKPATSAAGTENIYSEPIISAAGGGNGSKEASTIKIIICILVTVSVSATLALIVGCFVAVFVEIASLKSDHSSIVLHLNQLNQSIASIAGFYQQLADNVERSSEKNDKNHMQLTQNITVLESLMIGRFLSLPAASCAGLSSSFPSGYYWVTASNGSAVRAYCDMTRTCGNITRGWMRVAYLNLTDNGQQCPSGLEQRTISNRVTCGIRGLESGCSTLHFPINVIHPHSRVCGKVLGRMIGTPDGFEMYQRGTNLTLDDNYVDGVSLTHGEPRHHIWTFAAVRTSTSFNCMLGCYPPTSLQFISSEYSCDGGPSLDLDMSQDIVWDGNNCSLNDPSWFYRQLPQPITDGIEMRVCRDQVRSDEDIGIEHIEIYVQ